MKLIWSIIVFNIWLKCVNTQFDYNGYYKQPTDLQYQSIPHPNFMNNAELLSILSNSYNYNAEVCHCSCNECYLGPKPCCIQFCMKCMQENQHPNFVYVPYPYIVFNTPKVTSINPIEATTTVATTTTTTTTTIKTTTQAMTTEPETEIEPFSLNPEDILGGTYMKELSKGTNFANKNRNNQVRFTSLRRTKPGWIPKFGIVPIPDQLAEKLMFRIRQMKVLHPEKDTIRKIEPIYPNESNINI